MRNRTPLPWYLVFAADMLMIGAALLTFAYFHHVRGRSLGGVKQSIVFGEDAAPTPGPDQGESAPGEGEGAGPTPAPPIPVGDFSAVFPTGPADPAAVKSHVDDNVRVNVTLHQSDNLAYYVADVWVKNIRSLRTAFSSGEFLRGSKYFKMPAEVARANNAIVAVSGDFASYRDTGVVIKNGDLYRDTLSTEDVCILYADGVMETYYANEFDLQAAVGRGAYQSWCFGPKLIDNGQKPGGYNCSDAVYGKNPRAAIGYYEPGHYCLVVVDGRQEGYSKGLDMAGLSQLFLDLGCVDAYNLDGGQTAAMVFGGEVVSKPYKDGREVADIIYVA